LRKLVHPAVAVVVSPVAHFFRAGARQRVVIVAVQPTFALRIRQAVAVVVFEVVRAYLKVGSPTAVVVEPITELGSNRADGGIVVVTIRSNQGPATGRRRALEKDWSKRVAILVLVRVHVPIGRLRGFVSVRIAIVVLTVAHLHLPGVARRICIVAIRSQRGRMRRTRARDDGRSSVAETVSIRVAIPRHGHGFIRRPVTIVVQAVTDFHTEWVHRKAQIIAICTAVSPVTATRRHVPVSVHVGTTDRGHVAVFIVPRQIANLSVSWKTIPVCVIAIVTQRSPCLVQAKNVRVPVTVFVPGRVLASRKEV